MDREETLQNAVAETGLKFERHRTGDGPDAESQPK
jgi:hypothetical protein